MKISKIATILLIVGFAALTEAARHRQNGVKSLLSNAGSRNEEEEFGSDLKLECNNKPKCLEKEPCGCELESEGPQGTVSVSVGSSESYNCNDSAFTTFNFPSIDDYTRSGLGDSDEEEYNRCRPRNRCRQPPAEEPRPTPFVAQRPRTESCNGNMKRPIGNAKP